METKTNFWDDTTGPGYLKAGFLGFPKSGKTYTSTLLAIAAQKILCGGKGPISFYDTETGSAYVRELIHKLAGAYPLVRRSRSLKDLIAWAQQSKVEGVAAGIVDSITHPWRELCDSYLAQKNAARIADGKRPVKRLEFQDWNVIKPKWGEWTDLYLNEPLNLIIAGRAGWEYEMSTNDEGQKELNKVGVKMKTETEFGFEPALLVEMEATQDITGDSTQIRRRATVIGDRFNILDGQTFYFPTTNDPVKALDAVIEAFGPHLEMLKGGASVPIDMESKTDLGVDESGDAEWSRERRERTILCEEIQAEITRVYPGQSATEKKAKLDLIKDALGTGSWTKVENMKTRDLREGLEKIKAALANVKPHAEKEVA